MFDEQVVAVQTGYWAAYYSNSKHPKSVKEILNKMLRQHETQSKGVQAPAPVVDVEAYLEQERKFKERMNK